MKIVITAYDQMAIAVLPETDYIPTLANMDDPPAIGPTIKVREVRLQPRRHPDGSRRMVAYDRETDTLFVQADPVMRS